MSLAKIIWAVAVLAAIVFAFVTFEYAGLILVILGLASGWFVSLEHRRGVLIAAIFLIAGGAGALVDGSCEQQAGQHRHDHGENAHGAGPPAAQSTAATVGR